MRICCAIKINNSYYSYSYSA